LKFKGDSLSHEKVVSALPKNGDFFEKYEILLLDIKSGYIQYRESIIDTDYTKTYWNWKTGYKLFATESWTCTMFCDSGLRFEKFKDGTYQTIEREVLIPGMEQLGEMLVPGYKEADEPTEFRYVLPRKGKNILFCLDKTCIELKWNGETFEISDEKTVLMN